MKMIKVVILIKNWKIDTQRSLHQFNFSFTKVVYTTAMQQKCLIEFQVENLKFRTKKFHQFKDGVQENVIMASNLNYLQKVHACFLQNDVKIKR